MNPSDMKQWFPNGVPETFELSRPERIDLDSASAVRALLAERRGPGWVCTTDQVVRVSGDEGDISGIPLSAEIELGERQSLHLRQRRQGWTAWLLEDEKGDGTQLSFDQTFLSTGPSSGAGGVGGIEQPVRAADRPRLRYRTYFRKEPVQTQDDATRIAVWRPFAFRFLGWEEK